VKNKIKKICLVIPSLQAGGMERVMSELIWHFSMQNVIEIHLILYGIKRDIFYKIPDIVVIHRPEFKFNNNFRFISTIRTMLFLRKETKQIKPDSILSFGEVWNNMVLLSLLGLKYPIYISDRSQPDKSLGKMHDFLRIWLYPKATGIILQSEKAKDNFLRNISNRVKNVKVIGNPISKVESKRLIKRQKSVLMVGRLIKTKHQDQLIEIFASINKPDWKLFIVGYDHLKQSNMQRLKSLAKSLGIDHRVVFTGKQYDVESYYLESSIFAFTSSSEGFPNVIGEAMAAGLPVVAYDCFAGPSEMIEDGKNGYLVPLFDVKGFEEKLRFLMENPVETLNMGSYAKESIKKFSIEYIGDKFLRTISNLTE